MTPWFQGMFARAWNHPRELPDWHTCHRDPEWQRQWLRGWDEKNADMMCCDPDRWQYSEERVALQLTHAPETRRGQVARRR